DDPSAITTFVRYNGLAHQGNAFNERSTAFADDETYYPYLFTIDASSTVDPSPLSATETLSYAIDDVAWNLNGVAGGPVALGDASVPFTITGCMGGTSVLDCVLMFKGNDGNVYGDIDINFTVSDSSGGSRSEEHTSELQSRENLVCRLLL